jgi:hypothetical protein
MQTQNGQGRSDTMNPTGHPVALNTAAFKGYPGGTMRRYRNWFQACRRGRIQLVMPVSQCTMNIRTAILKNFSNASFPPETIGIMKDAMDAAVASLPDPVSSAHVQAIAETILRTAKTGERDPAILQRMALIELQITPRD